MVCNSLWLYLIKAVILSKVDYLVIVGPYFNPMHHLARSVR